MKFEQFLNEMPTMADHRVKKDDSKDANDWIRSIKDDESFNVINTFTIGGYEVVEFSKYEYGRVLAVYNDTKLILATKYDHYDKKYFSNEFILKTKGVITDEIINIIMLLANHFNRIGLMSGKSQTSGGRKMWNAIIQYAEKHNMKFGYATRDTKTYYDKSANDFLKFADNELYDSTNNKDRSKFKYTLFVEF